VCDRRAIQISNCYHGQDDETKCGFDGAYLMLIFGAIQVVLSQTPNFHNIQWLSIVAAITSFFYAFIGMWLSAGQITGMFMDSCLKVYN